MSGSSGVPEKWQNTDPYSPEGMARRENLVPNPFMPKESSDFMLEDNLWGEAEDKYMAGDITDEEYYEASQRRLKAEEAISTESYDIWHNWQCPVSGEADYWVDPDDPLYFPKGGKMSVDDQKPMVADTPPVVPDYDDAQPEDKGSLKFAARTPWEQLKTEWRALKRSVRNKYGYATQDLKTSWDEFSRSVSSIAKDPLGHKAPFERSSTIFDPDAPREMTPEDALAMFDRPEKAHIETKSKGFEPEMEKSVVFDPDKSPRKRLEKAVETKELTPEEATEMWNENRKGAKERRDRPVSERVENAREALKPKKMPDTVVFDPDKAKKRRAEIEESKAAKEKEWGPDPKPKKKPRAVGGSGRPVDPPGTIIESDAEISDLVRKIRTEETGEDPGPEYGTSEHPLFDYDLSEMTRAGSTPRVRSGAEEAEDISDILGLELDDIDFLPYERENDPRYAEGWGDPDLPRPKKDGGGGSKKKGTVEDKYAEEAALMAQAGFSDDDIVSYIRKKKKEDRKAGLDTEGVEAASKEERAEIAKNQLILEVQNMKKEEAEKKSEKKRPTKTDDPDPYKSGPDKPVDELPSEEDHAAWLAKQADKEEPKRAQGGVVEATVGEGGEYVDERGEPIELPPEFQEIPDEDDPEEVDPDFDTGLDDEEDWDGIDDDEEGAFRKGEKLQATEPCGDASKAPGEEVGVPENRTQNEYLRTGAHLKDWVALRDKLVEDTGDIQFKGTPPPAMPTSFMEEQPERFGDMDMKQQLTEIKMFGLYDQSAMESQWGGYSPGDQIERLMWLMEGRKGDWTDQFVENWAGQTESPMPEDPRSDDVLRSIVTDMVDGGGEGIHDVVGDWSAVTSDYDEAMKFSLYEKDEPGGIKREPTDPPGGEGTRMKDDDEFDLTEKEVGLLGKKEGDPELDEYRKKRKKDKKTSEWSDDVKMRRSPPFDSDAYYEKGDQDYEKSIDDLGEKEDKKRKAAKKKGKKPPKKKMSDFGEDDLVFDEDESWDPEGEFGIDLDGLFDEEPIDFGPQPSLSEIMDPLGSGEGPELSLGDPTDMKNDPSGYGYNDETGEWNPDLVRKGMEETNGPMTDEEWADVYAEFVRRYGLPEGEEEEKFEGNLYAPDESYDKLT